MINMKVVVRERKSWMESAKEVGELKQRVAQLEEELAIEKRNHALATAGVQLWQQEAEKITKVYRKEVGAAEYWREQYEKLQKDGKSISQLADMLIKANEERAAAIAEAADLNLELMDREFRIDELERRVKFLEAAAADGEIVS